jgi:hypothetical protein
MRDREFNRPDGTEKWGKRSLQGVNALPKLNRRYAAKHNNLSPNGINDIVPFSFRRND